MPQNPGGHGGGKHGDGLLGGIPAVLACPWQRRVEMNTTPYAEASDPCRLVKEPLVSVMMSTFNHEKYLGQAIESVLDQQRTFPIELIIAEDCSSDETRKIAFAYQKRAPESIRVLYSERNVGMHANGRRARFAARGKYGAWCEGDDFWHRQDKLSLQIPVLEENRDVHPGIEQLESRFGRR